jgi:hypothetical protein
MGQTSSGNSSIASGLSGLGAVGAVVGGVMQGQATKSADEYKAGMLDRAAQYGELKATQTNAQMTNNLNITLGNIDAVRAAAHTDPTSPTGAAVRDYTEGTGTERKNIDVDSILAQSQEDEANAAYLRKAGSDALLAGDITGATNALTDVAKGLSGMPGGTIPGGGGYANIPGAGSQQPFAD